MTIHIKGQKNGKMFEDIISEGSEGQYNIGPALVKKGSFFNPIYERVDNLTLTLKDLGGNNGMSYEASKECMFHLNGLPQNLPLIGGGFNGRTTYSIRAGKPKLRNNQMQIEGDSYVDATYISNKERE